MANNSTNDYTQHPRIIYPIPRMPNDANEIQDNRYRELGAQQLPPNTLPPISGVSVPSQSSSNPGFAGQIGASSSESFRVHSAYQFASAPVGMRPPAPLVHTAVPNISPGAYNVPGLENSGMGYYCPEAREYGDVSQPSSPLQGFYVPSDTKFGDDPTAQQQEDEKNRPWHCARCPATFVRRRDLARHERSIHTGTTPYLCKACGEGFVRSDARGRHWKNSPDCLAKHTQLDA